MGIGYPAAVPPERLDWRAPLIASALLTCNIVVALALIPPWQQPDEATHVALVELRRDTIAQRDTSRDPGREREVLESMARYRWWEHRAVGVPTPDLIPSNFAAAGRRVAVPSTDVARPTTYFLLAGRVFSWLPRLPVVWDMYVLRAISAAFGVLTLWVVWLGVRECCGGFAGVVVATILALHPHFAIVATAASADAAVNLLGACVWWQSVVAVKRRHYAAPLVALWTAAILAASADRMGVPLLAVALVVTATVIGSRGPLSGQRAAAAIPRAAVVGVITLGIAAWALHAFGDTYGWARVFTGTLAPVPGAMHWRSFMRFTWMLHESWWFSIGWGRYTAPGWWSGITAVLTFIAATGAVRQALRTRAADSRTGTFLALAAAAVAIQAFAVYWTYFRLANGAQGRYIFPVLAPSLVFLWAGIEAWVPHTRRPHAAAAVILLVALLDVCAWMHVGVPAYYASF
jgi:hypothetical protein